MTKQEEFLFKSMDAISEKGWCLEAFEHPEFELIFPDGLFHAATVYFEWTLKETFCELEKKDINELKTFAKIRLALMTRFGVLSPYKKAEKALFYYLLKNLKGPGFLYKIIDKIWFWAGDKSLDHNFYTKRALLAGVYTSTFFTFLEDTSEDLIKTQEKLDQRLAQVGQIPKFKEKLKSFLRFRS